MRIAIIGSGVVGTATGRGFAHHGHSVQFVDIDQDRVDDLREQGHDARTTLELTDEPTVIFLTLPTPNDGYRWDLSAMESGVRSVGRELATSNGFHTVVVRSTVPPGTTEGLVQPLLEDATGGSVGDAFALASNPEFLRARSAFEDFLHPRMTVIGSRSPNTRERLQELLAPFGGELRTFDEPATAELVKAAHNLFNAAKISFWNELWRTAKTLGIDGQAVADTVARSAEASYNPEYGIRGGAPYGGACLPKDTKGFLGFAQTMDIDMPLLEAVDEVNETMRRVADEAASSNGSDRRQRRTIDLVSVGGNGSSSGNGSSNGHN
ncbi:MAG: nucleotide sugar dehydrogenase [Nitriliruptorales bacterium]|nr:nucleotide sugar dehydrogenase [Nitriliruptorales bacterium]